MHLKKILVVDDHPVFRRGVSALLKDEWPHLETIEAGNGLEAIKQCGHHNPDVVLIDYSMPKLNGYDATVQLLKKHVDLKIILLTGYDTLAIALNFLKIGGRGFLVKGGDSDEIMHAIRTVLNGDYYFNSQHEAQLVKWLERGTKQKVPSLKFTSRELEIVLKLSRGMTSKEIADSMQLSARTLETYRFDLIRKTEVKNSLELIRFVYQNGVFS
jgi:DNA-binding NarL/FixJ family response regulator